MNTAGLARRAIARSIIASLLTASCTALPTPAPTGSADVSAGPIQTRAATPAPTEPFVPPAGWPLPPFTLSWARAEDPPPDFVDVGLTPTSRGFIAVGHSRSGPPFTGRAYRSKDGSHWVSVAGGEVFGDASLNAVVEAPSSKILLVAGTKVGPGTGNAQTGTVDGVAWRSIDLTSWSAATPANGLAGGDLRTVTQLGDAGFETFGGYASGETLMRCPSGCVDGVGIWRSLDGQAWARVYADEDHGLALTVLTSSLLFGGDIALGTPAIWRDRPSGWQRTDAPSGLGGIPTAVWTSGTCAEVIAASSRNTIYVSEDGGSTWRAVLGTKPALFGVVRLGEGWLAWNDSTNDLGLWTSTDGFNWGPIDYYDRSEGTFGVTAMALSGSTLVAVGSSADPGPFVASVAPQSEPPCLD